MSRTIYNGCRLIPAPFVGIIKNFTKTQDGVSIGSAFTITIVGTIVNFKGSPRLASSGGTGLWGGPGNRFWQDTGYPEDEVVDEDSRLNAALRKEEAIRALFAEEGKSLEWQSADGSQPMKCNPRIININFEQDIWYQTVRYTIVCEADVIYLNGSALGEDEFSDLINDASESWQFETDEGQPNSDMLPRTYRITHTISAVGKTFYEPDGTISLPAWERARNYAHARLGLDSTIMLSSGVNNLPSYYGGYNHVKNELIDKNGGSYSVTESWIIASGGALENFTVTTSENIESYIKNVKIEGEIRGLELRSPSNYNTITHSKHYNADLKWSSVQNELLTRAQLYTGLTLNTQPVSKVVGVNPVEGIINYSYEYDDRRANIMPNSKSEVINVTHNFGVDAFASVFVLGRANGPVLQNLGTRQAKTVDISVEIVMETPPVLVNSSLNAMKNFFTYSRPGITDQNGNPVVQSEYDALFGPAGILAANDPANYGYSNRYVHAHVESWNPKEGRYSMQHGWTYE